MDIRKTSVVLCSVLALASCKSEPASQPEPVRGDLEITAIQTSTKTYLGEKDGSQTPILWDAADEIWLRSGTQEAGTQGERFTTSASALKDGGKSAVFKGESGKEGPYVAVYPYAFVSPSSDNSSVLLNVPKTQEYVAKSFGAQANITAAVWESGTVATFENLVGTLKLTLSNHDGIRKITVADNDPASVLWGKCTITPGKDAVSKVVWTNSAADRNIIVLDCRNSSPSDPAGTTDYFLSVPEGAFGKGFTCDLYDASSRIVRTIEVTEDCTVSRSTIINVNKVDPEMTDFSGGDGSQADPFRIATPQDIVSLSDKCASNYEKYAFAHYVQTADIVMNGVKCNVICKKASEPFKGTYDGCRHSISNLAPALVAGSAYGMFAYADGAVIKDLRLADFRNNGSSANSAAAVGYAVNATISGIEVEAPLHFYNQCCGSIVGTMEGGSVTDCHYKGFVQNEKRTTFEGNSNATVIGGIAGNLKAKALVKGCTVQGNVTGIGRFVGGIAGSMIDSGIEDCTVTSGSSVVGDDYDTGGIVGWMRGESVVKNCSVDASVACWYHDLGGIVGLLYNGSVIDCAVGSNAQVRCGMGKTGGIAGYITSSDSQNVLIDGCAVYGDVTGTWAVGGIAGLIEPKAAGAVINIVNSAFVGGDIWTAGFYSNSDGNFALAGGIAGWARMGSSVKGLNIVNCFSDPACLRVEWKKAAKLGIAGILGNQSGSSPVRISGCYTTLSKDRIMLGGSNDLEGQTRYGSVAGTVESQTTLEHISYPAGTSLCSNSDAISRTDVEAFSVAAMTDGTVLGRMNGFVTSYSGGLKLRKWVASTSGYPTFEGIPANPTVGRKQPMRVSLIGDSLTSFDGYVPHGYKSGETEGDAAHGYRSHYPSGDGAVTTADQTYWYILTYKLLSNAMLDTNLAYSGTAVTHCTNSSYSSQYWYNDDFCKRYIENGGVGSPDIIIINGGANDWARPSAYKMLGSVAVTSTTAPADNLTDPVFAKADACRTMEEAMALPDGTFFEAYVKMVTMMIIQYPDVKIVVLIHDTLSSGMEQAMIKISDHYRNHCRYVDLYAVNGFNDLGFNGEYLAKGYQPNIPKHDFDWTIKTITGHGDHYSAQGMLFIANKIYTELGSWLESGKWSDSSAGNISDFNNVNGRW